jgi:zinc protease
MSIHLFARNGTLVALFALVTAASPIAAQESATFPEPVASVEGITEYSLDNGLRVLLFPDPSKPTTTVNVTYFVGSRHEAYGETGMAHLLEHLVFQGTPSHPNIMDELTERGALPNGTTWVDRTNYFETFPATEDNLAWALELEADRMVNSFISADDLASEFTVVRNEMEAGENRPFGILMERTLSTAYLWHNYGNSTIGARSDVENVPIGRLQAFYRKYYQPDNAMLVIAGRFEEDRALELVQETFGQITPPTREGDMYLWPTYTVEPTQDGERSVTLRRVGDEQYVMHAYHVPPGSHEQFAAIEVLGFILGDRPSGRLYKAMVETEAAARVGAMDLQLREASPLLLFAQVREGRSLDEAAQLVTATVDGLLTDPVTDEEVERAKAALLKNSELLFTNSERFGLRMSEWAAMGDWRLFFIHRDRLKEVTTLQVQRAAMTYLKPSNRTVGLFIPTDEPDRAEIPAPPDVMALAESYEGGEAIAVGEAFDATPANIESRTTRQEMDSGFKLALLDKQTRGEAVVSQLTLRFGTEDALRGRATDGSFAASMLMRGTTQRTRQEIEDELDRLKAQVSVGGGPVVATASVSTLRSNLPQVLRLLSEVLHSPSFQASEFEILKQERLSALESQLADPQALAFTEYQRRTNPRDTDHPYYTPTIEEEVALTEGATLEGARSFYEEFYGAAAGTMAIVGDYEPAEITPIVEETFGDWVSDVEYVRTGNPYQEITPESVEIETPDKANAFLLAGTVLPLDDGHDDYPALVLGNFMLGGGFLSSRLATRIRHEEGLSYGVGSMLQAHPIDERGQFMTYAISAPENSDRVEAAWREEVQKVLDEGFTADEVEEAKAGYTEFQKNLRARDNVLAGRLSQDLYFGRTMDREADMDARIQALTVEEINAAFRQWIDLEAMTIVKAGDFAKPPVS